MSEKNCRDLAKENDVDGFLVGGASLKPACKFLILLMGLKVHLSDNYSRRHRQLPSVKI